MTKTKTMSKTMTKHWRHNTGNTQMRCNAQVANVPWIDVRSPAGGQWWQAQWRCPWRSPRVCSPGWCAPCMWAPCRRYIHNGWHNSGLRWGNSQHDYGKYELFGNRTETKQNEYRIFGRNYLGTAQNSHLHIGYFGLTGKKSTLGLLLGAAINRELWISNRTRVPFILTKFDWRSMNEIVRMLGVNAVPPFQFEHSKI